MTNYNFYKSIITLLFHCIPFVAISQTDLSGTWKGETGHDDWKGAVETYIKKTGDNTYIGINHVIWSKSGEQSREVKKKFQATLNGTIFSVHEYDFIQRPSGGGALVDYQFKVDSSSGQMKLINQHPLMRFSVTIPPEYETYLVENIQPKNNNTNTTGQAEQKQDNAQMTGDPFFAKEFAYGDTKEMKVESNSPIGWTYIDVNNPFPIVYVFDDIAHKQFFFKYYGYDAAGSYLSYINGRKYRWNGDTLTEIDKIPIRLNNDFEKAKIEAYEKKTAKKWDVSKPAPAILFDPSKINTEKDPFRPAVPNNSDMLHFNYNKFWIYFNFDVGHEINLGLSYYKGYDEYGSYYTSSYDGHILRFDGYSIINIPSLPGKLYNENPNMVQSDLKIHYDDPDRVVIKRSSDSTFIMTFKDGTITNVKRQTLPKAYLTQDIINQLKDTNKKFSTYFSYGQFIEKKSTSDGIKYYLYTVATDGSYTKKEMNVKNGQMGYGE